MKTNIFIKIIVLSVIALNLTSCEDFLTEDPKGNITETYALTEEGAEKEVLSLYQINTDLLEHLYMVGEMGSDATAWGGNTRNYWKATVIYEDAYMVDNADNANLWKWLYVGLTTANTAINSVNNADIKTEGKREELLSEAHAMRAFYLHELVVHFGPYANFTDEPIKSIDQITVNQPGVATFYKTIFADLDIADQALPMPAEIKDKEFGRLNLGVSKALRMKALMSLAWYEEATIQEVGLGGKKDCYQKAADIANSIINDYGYRLENDFSAIFDPANQENDEIIWSIQYGNTIFDSQNNYLARYWVSQVNRSVNSYTKTIDGLQAHSVYYGREYRTLMPTYYFISAFNKYDKRREATFISAYCRTPEGGVEFPDFSDTLLIRSLDVVPQEIKQQYAQRGIICDDISDLYDLETGEIKGTNARSCANNLTKWLDNSRLTAKQEYSFKDAILIRLGEVYITLAEAYVQLGEKGQAAQVITELRKRTLMPGHEEEQAVTADDMTLEFILDEGIREMGGEIGRWEMLKRALSPEDWVQWLRKHNPDTATEGAQGIGVQTYHVYRPVPLSTVNSYAALGMNFKKTEGYTY